MQNLLDFSAYPPTKNDYLDGRYFGVVLGNYPGVSPEPFYLEMDGERKLISVPPKPANKNNHKCYYRVVVVTPELSHSMLLIVDDYHTSVEVYNFVPDRENEDLYTEAARIAARNLTPWKSNYVTDYYYRIVYDSDMCNAHVLRHTLSEFISLPEGDIRRFATAVEENFGDLLNNDKEVERGPDHGWHHGHGYGHFHRHAGFYGPGYYGPGWGLLGGLALGTALGAAAYY